LLRFCHAAGNPHPALCCTRRFADFLASSARQGLMARLEEFTIYCSESNDVALLLLTLGSCPSLKVLGMGVFKKTVLRLVSRVLVSATLGVLCLEQSTILLTLLLFYNYQLPTSQHDLTNWFYIISECREQDRLPPIPICLK
jgi:hypothetical protein